MKKIVWNKYVDSRIIKRGSNLVTFFILLFLICLFSQNWMFTG